jgi:ribonuclease P protein component
MVDMSWCGLMWVAPQVFDLRWRQRGRVQPGLVATEPPLSSIGAVRAPSLKSADFQRALGTRPVARTAHFSLHVLPRLEPAVVRPRAAAAGPVPLAAPPATQVAGAELSTGPTEEVGVLVDDLAAGAKPEGPNWRLGLVLPKKQARRSVTRSLMRHQAREAFRRHAPRVLAAGRHGCEVDGWVVRLRAPFDRQQFPSAASEALSAAVRQELDELWSRLGGPRA